MATIGNLMITLEANTTGFVANMEKASQAVRG